MYASVMSHKDDSPPCPGFQQGVQSEEGRGENEGWGGWGGRHTLAESQCGQESAFHSGRSSH